MMIKKKMTGWKEEEQRPKNEEIEGENGKQCF